MSEAKYQTLKHIENVRNYLSKILIMLVDRMRDHDKTKLEEPEVSIFEEYTEKLKDSVYGSEEYFIYLKEMHVALEHHYAHNRHHPEHFVNGINDMNMIDLLEMLVDWKAASLRHATGDIYRSIEINQERFGYSDEMKGLLKRTMEYIEQTSTRA